MRDRLTRRRVLGGLAAASIVGIAGCGEPATDDGSPDGEESPVGEEETAMQTETG